MITIRPVSKKTLELAKPIVLAFTSVIFNSIALVSTIKATIESTRIIDERQSEGGLTTKDVITEIAPKYLVPAGAFVLGQALTVGSAILSRDQSLALSGAIAATDYRYRRYREKNKEIYGLENDDRILIELSKEATPKYVDYSNCVGNLPENVEDGYVFNDSPTYFAPEGKILFFDEYRYGQPTKYGHLDDGYFVCTVNQFQQARLHLNRNFMINEGWVSLNDFYRFLGLSEIPGGDDLCWDLSSGILFIDITLKPFQLDENLTAYRISYDFPPDNWRTFA